MKKGKESKSARAMKKGKKSAPAMKKGKESVDAAAMGGDVVALESSDSNDVFLSGGQPSPSDPEMKKGKEVADAAAMGGDVIASENSDSNDVFLSGRRADMSLPIVGDSYDVFLSGRRADMSLPIVGFLYRGLAEAGIGAFRDYIELGDAGEIDGELLRVIDGAKIYIPIFSRFYAAGVGCLKKLAAMVERKAKWGGGKTILPIFYDVEPGDVRLETPLYCDNLDMHAMRFGCEEIEAWENALKEVGSLPGWETVGGSNELAIKKIVKEVMVKLKALKGIDKQLEDMMDLLDLEVSDVRIVGIWGEDGVGKTTLSKVIYEKISSQFDRCSFLADIGATVKQLGGIQLLQSKLMSDILNEEYEVDQVEKGVDFFKGILRNMKVLIVLDDVEVQSELHEIVGKKLDWFDYGSRIIVTTSRISVLPNFISRGWPCLWCVCDE